MQPEGFKPEDVYVCESRYTARTKTFKKIKIWSMPSNSVKLVSREVPLPVVRVASMFVSAKTKWLLFLMERVVASSRRYE